MTSEKALNTIAAICSKKEYCSHDVREKLRKWEIPENEITRILDFLYKNKFVDDSRFAAFYARDKFRFNKWGRQKINQMLRQKGIATEVIADALATLSPATYDETCMVLLQGKMKILKNDTPIRIKARLIRFAAGRGFDFDTINRCLAHIIPNLPQEWDE